jgi:uncharacterized repeat protein (TIGR01451 family)
VRPTGRGLRLAAAAVAVAALLGASSAGADGLPAGGHSVAGHVWRDAPGTPVEGAVVQACATGTLVCRTASSDATGFFVVGGLADGGWQLTASPPEGSGLRIGTRAPVFVAGIDFIAQDLTLHEAAPLPPGASIESGRGRTTSGVPAVLWDSPFTLTLGGCRDGSGTATLTLADGYSDAEGLTESPSGSGTYAGTFAAPSPHHGAGTIAFTVCGVAGALDLYIDPSGVVLTTEGQPVSGATVTLERADDTGAFSPVLDGSAVMSPGNRRNPDLTDEDGHFGWDVLAGVYRVRAEKDGCSASETGPLMIPPPATDVVLRLDCTPPPTTTTTEQTTTQATTEQTTTQATTTAPATTTEAPPSATTTAAAATVESLAATSDVGVVLSSPFAGHTGEPVTFTATVTNAGPDAATGVVLRVRIPAGANLVSIASKPVGTCSGDVCRIGTLEVNAAAVVTLVLSPTGAGPLTASVSVEADHDSDPADNNASASTAVVTQVQPPPPPPPPVVPGTFNAVSAGTIKVNGVDRPADVLLVLSSGDIVDVTAGVITLTASDGSYGSFSSSRPVVRTTSARGARLAPGDVQATFTVEQAVGVTRLTLVGGDFSVCTRPRSLSAKNQTPVRQLWGTAKGNFETKGRYGAATVRGTIWLTQDRCDGTLTSVVKDTVVVTDTSLNKTVTVNEGQSYLALPPRSTTGSFKPPAVKQRSQTAATVRQRGLVWGGRTFGSRAELERWLRARGTTWAQFARTHPALAGALAARR